MLFMGTIQSAENSMSASVVSAPERRLLSGVLASAAGLCALAIGFRYLIIERQPIAEFCEAAGAPWWCAIREGIIVTFYSDMVGIMSLVMGLLALLLGGRPSGRFWAIAAIIWAAPSIVLYSADYAAPAFLLGLVMLVRDLLRAPGARLAL